MYHNQVLNFRNLHLKQQYVEHMSNTTIQASFHYRNHISPYKMESTKEHLRIKERRITTQLMAAGSKTSIKSSPHSHALHSSGCLKGKASPLSMAAIQMHPFRSLADIEDGEADRWAPPSGLGNVVNFCGVRAKGTKLMIEITGFLVRKSA